MVNLNARTTTIAITTETYLRLEKLKIIPQEPFDNVIQKLLDEHNKSKV
jgi:predicted CopG family antitoxin